jgi:hypothetical protein
MYLSGCFNQKDVSLSSHIDNQRQIHEHKQHARFIGKPNLLVIISINIFIAWQVSCLILI